MNIRKHFISRRGNVIPPRQFAVAFGHLPDHQSIHQSRMGFLHLDGYCGNALWIRQCCTCKWAFVERTLSTKSHDQNVQLQNGWSFHCDFQSLFGNLDVGSSLSVGKSSTWHVRVQSIWLCHPLLHCCLVRLATVRRNNEKSMSWSVFRPKEMKIL